MRVLPLFATAASPASAAGSQLFCFSTLVPVIKPSEDGPPCQIIHSLLYCIIPAMDPLCTVRLYHFPGMSAGFQIHVHHLHLSTLQPFPLPAKIVCLEKIPTMMHPQMPANKGFVPGVARGPQQVTTLSALSTSSKLQSSSAAQLQLSFCSVRGLQAACYYDMQVLGSLNVHPA